MRITLNRIAYLPENTQGKLSIGDWSCYTLERPWIRGDYPGGKPFKSCIPDGLYDLVPYIRQTNNPKSNGDRVFAMVNPDLGVYFRNADRPTVNGKSLGRYKCLIHPANYVDQVQGCCAPGEARPIDAKRNEAMVTNSRVTMSQLISRIGWESGHTIQIKSALGALDTPLVAA